MKKTNMAAVAVLAALGLAFLLAGCGKHAIGDDDELLSSSSSAEESSSSSSVSSSSVIAGDDPQSSSSIAVSSSSSSVSSSSVIAGDDPQSSSSVAVSSSSSSVISPSSSSSSVYWNTSISYGTLTDSRDGKSYRTVEMPDGKVWMAENLNYAASGSWCYGDNTSYCATYGRLYDWAAAKAVCPSGWHLPSDGEWSALMNALSGPVVTKLKAGSGWNGGGNGTDDYGFSALPGGNRSRVGSFSGVGDGGLWWSFTESDASNAYYLPLFNNLAVWLMSGSYKENGLSVRCLQDYSSSSSSVAESSSSLGVYWNTSISYGTLTDSRDGKSYRTVDMPDGKVWMAENLNYAASGSWCYDDNTSNCADYGRLYDWATAKAVCPSGWHLPSYSEWDALGNAISGSVGTKLKSEIGWSSGGNGTDDYGFSALPGGSSVGSYFFGVGLIGYWWSTTENDASYAYYRSLYYSSADLVKDDGSKGYGYSVRCLMD